MFRVNFLNATRVDHATRTRRGRQQMLELGSFGMEFAIKRPLRAVAFYNAINALMGSSALSTPHMHEQGDWTICDRADCDGSTKSRASEIHGYLAIAVVASYLVIFAASTLLGSNACRLGVIFLSSILCPMFLQYLFATGIREHKCRFESDRAR